MIEKMEAYREVCRDEAIRAQEDDVKVFCQFKCPTCGKIKILKAALSIEHFTTDYWCRSCLAKKEDYTKCEMIRYLVEEMMK